MNRQVWCRPIDKKNPAENKLFVEWLYAQRELNKFNPELITREQVRVYTLFDSTGVLGFMLAGVGLFADCWCFRPDLSDGDKSRALKSAQHFLVSKAFELQALGVFMRPSDARYENFISHYGWKKKSEDNLYQLDLNDLGKAEHEDHN